MATLFGRQITQHQLREYAGQGQVGGITHSQLTEGKSAGVEAIRIQNGTGLDFTVLAGRALDIAHATYNGMSLCWRSATGDVAASYYEPEGLEWLRTFFGGLLTTCGLTSFGPPVDDEYGSRGQHGRISCVPAENVSWAETWAADECTFAVQGTVRESRVYGENLSLRRRIWTRLGSTSIWLEDVVTNEGFERTPHMILYHCNAGFPLLSEGARLYVSHSRMEPRDVQAEKAAEHWGEVIAPQAGFSEEVFVHESAAGPDGLATALLANPALCDRQGLALCLRYNPQQLPAFVNWRMMGRGTYVMGMEPANTPAIKGREHATQSKSLPFLEPGESRRYELEFQILTGPEVIDKAIHAIESVNANF